MTTVFLEVPQQIASSQSQENEFILDKAIKSCTTHLTVYLFGDITNIQKYISTLYLSIWDYCLLYKKIDLENTVIPIIGENCETLYQADIHECYIANTFPSTILNTIMNKRKEINMHPIEFHTINCDYWNESVIPLDWETSTYVHVHTACVGGTFDHLHPGHRILLTLASLICDRLVIGLTTDCMLQSKAKHELIQPYEERQRVVLEFLHLIKPDLQVEISPLQDIYGPSVLMDDIEGIVVSLETIVGAKKINEVREQKNMKPLKIFTVNRGSKYNLSSSFIRDRNLSVCFK